jgi:hypothetical protein
MESSPLTSHVSERRGRCLGSLFGMVGSELSRENKIKSIKGEGRLGVDAFE